jgi:hypothetical protein
MLPSSFILQTFTSLHFISLHFTAPSKSIPLELIPLSLLFVTKLHLQVIVVAGKIEQLFFAPNLKLKVELELPNQVRYSGVRITPRSLALLMDVYTTKPNPFFFALPAVLVR